MPINSRCHVVEQFNEGRYSYVIASDANDVSGESHAMKKDGDEKVMWILCFSFKIAVL